ncbi:hypothetical protein IQ235_01195 [Oscillatoriales cyanobacterium LEGE 11467]|uniref:Coiled coil domain-containing protein n=1 Tax=Zarconia navalis LEGE 11467 TaxID=1828826 RepID=A0A928VSN6_9CYAN|nr:hypothetical protein [Zarconia navalis]MBE9039411.1 hypothetical protein [Zarconia navalis LEGE 11467]
MATDETKQAYQAKVKAQLDKFNAQIDELKAKATQAKADATIDYHDRMEELYAKRDVAARKFKDIQETSTDAWDEVKVGFEKAWGELQGAFDKAKDKLK